MNQVRQVRIRNPFDIAVAVWENVSTELGLVQLEHQLSKDSIEGKWRIEADGHAITFEVTKYVLPRFKIDLLHPKIIYCDTKSVTFTVCGRYSFGGNVKGSAYIRIEDSHSNMKPISTVKKLENSCANFTFNSNDLNLDRIKLRYSLMDPEIRLHITSSITEYGTDRLEIKSGKTLISLKPFNMRFVSDNIFMSGLPYHGRLEFSNINADLQGEIVQICYNLAIKKSWNYLNDAHCTNFTVTNQKFIDFQVLPLKHNVIHLHLSATSLNHSNVADDLLVARLYSPSLNYIYLDTIKEKSKCKSHQHFTVFYTTEDYADDENITFYYMVKSRDTIYKLKRIGHTVSKSQQQLIFNNAPFIGEKHRFIKTGSPFDQFTFKFKLDERIISNYQLLIYYVSKQGEIVTATKEIHVESCLNNKVKAEWATAQANPGSKVTLSIETSSNSLCAVSAVDQSTRFMDQKQALNTNSFLEYFIADKETPQSSRKSCLPPTKKHRDAIALTENNGAWDLKRRRKRFVFSFSEDFDSYDLINKFGTTVITNFKVITKTCYTGPALANNNPPVQFLKNHYESPNEDNIVPIRSFFPETWLWELIPVKHSAQIYRDLPHTITDWVTDVMCISESEGVGFSETTKISAFQPFFVDVSVPYSIKRGEVLYLHVTVFNYLNYSLPIRLHLGESKGLKLVDIMNRRTVSYCVPASDTMSHVFDLKAIEMGIQNVTILAELDSGYPGDCGPNIIVNKRDVVFKPLLVEPEGYPITNTRSVLLCANEYQNIDSITWDLKLPEDIIAGTAQAKLTVNGDLLVQTIENLDQLLVMPMGCGEQIMASLAPNLYILKYLESLNALTPSNKQKILRNLKMGYQRILNYIHKDGSFSAFGYHDPAGSMFLTAFVVRVLKEAKNHIYIDQKIIDKAVNWIYQNQLENGCFNTMLHVFQDMGGASTENSTASLTAYVILSLLDAEIEIPEAIKTNAKYCIRGHYHLDKYTLAISSYALFRIHWYSEADRMLKKLEQISSQKDNMLWWSNKDSNSSLASDIEITSYALQSLVYYRTQENLAKAHSVVRWLSTMLSAQGGFQSTQDTVVALDALTKYSLFIQSQPLDLDVSVEAHQQDTTFTVKSEDRLKAKRIILKQSEENTVTLTVDGQGCVLGQLISSYYVRQLPVSDTFKLDTEINSVSNIDECSVASLSSCLAYTGPELQANMAILEVALPSGYKADRASLYRLINENSKLKRFEEIGDKVILYFTKLDQEQVCVTFNINENSIVQSRSDSTIKLYDYYKPDYSLLQFYKIKEKCKMQNLTMPDILASGSEAPTSAEVGKNVVKRDATGLNPDFVDMDIELEVPKGMEANMVTKVKPAHNRPWGANMISVDNDANTIDTNDDNSRNKRQNTAMNPDFVDRDVDMAMPGGNEGNIPMYMLPENRTSKN